jgi:hypothetical protein
MMRSIVCVGLLAATFLMGHGYCTQSRAQSPRDRPPELMTAPNSPNQKAEATNQQGKSGGAANICWELVAFLEQQQSGVGSGSPQAAPNAKPANEGATTASQTTPSADRPQQTSGQTAPIPTDQRGGASARVSLDQAKSLAQANDIRTCRDLTREMRRSGVALPPGLIALAALKEELLLGGGK